MNLNLAVVFDEPQPSEAIREKLTRERVVPIISANISWLILGTTS